MPAELAVLIVRASRHVGAVWGHLAWGPPKSTPKIEKFYRNYLGGLGKVWGLGPRVRANGVRGLGMQRNIEGLEHRA